MAIEGGPCYRCLYPQPPAPGVVPSCAEGGVLGVLPGIIGTIQAIEAIKIILGKGETLSGRLLLFDALDMRFREMKVRRDPNCPVCGDQPSITELIDYQDFCGVPTPGSEAAKIEPQSPWDVSPVEAKAAPAIRRGAIAGCSSSRMNTRSAICNGQLIPLGELADRLNELNRDD